MHELVRGRWSALRTRVRRARTERAGNRRSWVTVGAAVTVPAVVATFAVLYPGVPVAQVDLNDGAAWLTNTSALRLGRFNSQIDELNAGLVSTAAEFDVLQDAGDVLLVEPGTVSVVDPASVMLGSSTAVPFGATVSMAHGVVAVVDPSRGAVWVRTTATLGSLSVASQEPDLDLGRGGAAVVARSGVVLGVDADGGLHRAVVTDAGVTATVDGALAAGPGGTSGPVDQLTAVGEVLVALSGQILRTPAGSVDLTRFGDDLTLQQPGPDAAVVLVASRTALLEIPLDGGGDGSGGLGDVVDHATGGSGRPAAPVRVGACAHGAWSSAVGSYLQLCDGAEPVVSGLEAMSTADVLVFRVNRDVVVLNDTLRGRLWVPLEDPELREPNWQDILPDEDTQEAEQKSESQASTQNIRAECTAQSAAPAAADDDYGVRAGRTAILSVIDNDASSDCGILVISEHDPLPAEFGTVTAVYGGRALQLTTPPGATGTAELTYTITDGRGTSAPSTATVRLTVRDPGVNSPPAQVRTGTLAVEQGAQGTYDALPDFRDPDGDPLLLVGATAAGGTVRTRQDGSLTFQSDGSLGRQAVRVLVSDGVETVTGSLTVDVVPTGSLAPVIDPVHAVTYVDEAVVMRPLDSVRSASREPVRLAGVDDVAGATVSTDLEAGTFTFTAARAGTYYVSFLVTASPQQATGVARIDVVERPAQVPPPVAVLDRALLPPGGEVSVDPLANDVDPAGGILVLQSVEAPAESGLRLAVLGHQLVRITSTRVLEAPVRCTYTISNGGASATGEILVQPIPASATQQAPVVPNVTVSVRTGGVVTIPVLAGAYDPDGDVMHVARELVEPLGPGQGLLFVSGDVLRYQAPATAVQAHATFAVADPAGNLTAATLTVDVRPSDAATKSPPRPRPLVARVFEGETIRIPVPLIGIDPDGDGVSLLGQDQAPTKGRITEVGADWIEYEALPGELGTDTFTYAVEDWVGQRAVATIRVGIAARPTTAAQVVSRNDDVSVRSGQAVEVRVLANDVDTGGGVLTLSPELGLAAGTDAHVEGNRIAVQTPTSATVLQISYTATNERGGRDTAVLTVTVTDDAPILAPVARDVVVPATETINRTSVEVDVLAVAQNPSGPLSDLKVSVDASVADVATVTSRGTVVVTLVDRAQTLPYLLTNSSPQAGGLSAYAFITVPALGDFPPMPRPHAPALVVMAGDELVIALDEQVQVAPGRTARVLDPARVTATKADGSPLVRDDRTLVYRAQSGYAGPSSISVAVTDGTASDTSARTKVLTLPITVLATQDYPPTFSPSVISVSPGEVAAQVDLTKFTSAPVGTATGSGRYTFAITSAVPAGFHVSIDGTVLAVSADASVPRGTAGGISLAIGYGVAGTLPAQVDFRVVASIRPLARVIDHTVPDGVEGTSSTVAALDGAFNPFPSTPLTVVDATVETPGAGTAGVSGGSVTVRPALGFIGPMVTRYRVQDATGDPGREVEGRITVVVRGRPTAPTAPRVVEVRDRTVVLAWDAPVNNGAPITGYRVTTQPGGAVRECAGTTCTIDSLTNAVEYTFTVTAKNAVDWSDPSPRSAPARPDAKPFAPAAPLVARGDAQVQARWTEPATPGSPVVKYLVEISPAPRSGPSSVETTSTGYAFGGLRNGTAYTVRVRALNNAPDPGDWSPSSVAVVPAREPDAPAGVSASFGRFGDGTITARWDLPADDGGDPVTEFQVSLDGAWQQALDASVRSFSFPARAGRPYAIAVRARNTIGWSPSAGTSGEIWGVPGQVVRLTAVDDAARNTPWARGTVTLGWEVPTETGGEQVSIDLYRVQVDGNLLTETTKTTATVSNLTGGVGHSVTVTARNSKQEWGDPVTVSATATTVPQAPTLASTTPAAGSAAFTASGGSGGSAISSWTFTVTATGAGTIEVRQDGNAGYTFVNSKNVPVTVTVRAVATNSLGSSEVGPPVTVEVAAAPVTAP
ncbi:Ig-like domain-containing protein [Pengzhenrongella phosphoraccumulans]|uniref:Ig-like domain-containing protein n=1 Tax=Pengzhenrongella phosphoraccumulans TaxID=3114394 RepID=UPI003890AFC3